MSRRRVVVTGLGMASAVGVDEERRVVRERRGLGGRDSRRHGPATVMPSILTVGASIP